MWFYWVIERKLKTLTQDRIGLGNLKKMERAERSGGRRWFYPASKIQDWFSSMGFSQEEDGCVIVVISRMKSQASVFIACDVL